MDCMQPDTESQTQSATGLTVENETAAASRLPKSLSRLSDRLQLILQWPLDHRRESAALVVLIMMGVMMVDSPAPEFADADDDTAEMLQMMSEFNETDQSSSDTPFYSETASQPPSLLQIPAVNASYPSDASSPFAFADHSKPMEETTGDSSFMKMTGSSEAATPPSGQIPSGNALHASPAGTDSSGSQVRFRGAIRPVQ